MKVRTLFPTLFHTLFPTRSVRAVWAVLFRVLVGGVGGHMQAGRSTTWGKEASNIGFLPPYHPTCTGTMAGLDGRLRSGPGPFHPPLPPSLHEKNSRWWIFCSGSTQRRAHGEAGVPLVGPANSLRFIGGCEVRNLILSRVIYSVHTYPSRTQVTK